MKILIYFILAVLSQYTYAQRKSASILLWDESSQAHIHCQWKKTGSGLREVSFLNHLGKRLGTVTMFQDHAVFKVRKGQRQIMYHQPHACIDSTGNSLVLNERTMLYSLPLNSMKHSDSLVNLLREVGEKRPKFDYENIVWNLWILKRQMRGDTNVFNSVSLPFNEADDFSELLMVIRYKTIKGQMNPKIEPIALFPLVNEGSFGRTTKGVSLLKLNKQNIGYYEKLCEIINANVDGFMVVSTDFLNTNTIIINNEGLNKTTLQDHVLAVHLWYLFKSTFP